MQFRRELVCLLAGLIPAKCILHKGRAEANAPWSKKK